MTEVPKTTLNAVRNDLSYAARFLEEGKPVKAYNRVGRSRERLDKTLKEEDDDE